MKFEKIFSIIIFVLWIIISLTVGINHEAWADEAQSWLIARDSSVFELISDVLKYDGHPILWYLILKFLQIFHFPYKFLFIIPILFTGFGVFLLLFKSKLPLYIKYLFPFTFFIAYQYAIFGRNYSLAFPILALIAVIFKQRLDKMGYYAFLLILLSNVSAHCYVLAFILLLFLIYDVIKNKLVNLKSISLITAIITVMLLTALMLIKPQDGSFPVSLHMPTFIGIIIVCVKGFFNLTYFSYDYFIKFSFILILYILSFMLYCKNLYQFIFALSLNLGILLVLASVYANYWHCGYIILTLIFTIWILNEENHEIIKYNYTNVLFTTCFLVMAFIQINWSLKCICFDLFHRFSGSYEAYQFIKENNLDKYDMVGLGFRTIAIQPYFKHNIYKNFDQSYWKWQYGAEEKVYKNAINLAPIVVVDVVEMKKYQDIIENLTDEEYNLYNFNGKLCSKGEIKEPTDILIFVKKGILIKEHT